MGDLTALRLLADEYSGAVLTHLDGGARSQRQLESELPGIAHATLHGRLLTLDDTGTIERTPHGKSLRCSITPAGQALLAINEAASIWAGNPPTSINALPTWRALRALDGGWRSGVLPVLARRAMRRPEIDDQVELTHHQTQGRLDALRRAGLTQTTGTGRSMRHTVSPFGRRAMGIIIRATGWQRRFGPPETQPGGPLQLQQAVRVALPLVQLGEELTGLLALTFSDPSPGAGVAGLTAVVQRGRVVAFPPIQDATPTALVHGSVADWCEAVETGTVRSLRVQGTTAFAAPLVRELQTRLVI